MNITIRTASKEDAPKLLEIYAYYVEHTAITFEFEVPSLAEFEQRIATILQNYPYLVAEVDGDIAGYVYASRFRTRAAYDWCVETSIYLDAKYQHLGLGRMLYNRLEEILKKQNVTNLYACVADPVEEDEYLDRNSEHFHEAMGYKTVAKFQKCGSKFGCWYNLIGMEKIIGEHACPPKEFIPFNRLKIISDIVEDGESEEAVIARQGKSEQIAREILSNSNPEYLKNKDWRGITLLICSVLLVLASVVSTFFLWRFKKSMSATIGIIGGADGPTSIFLAGTFGTPWGIYIGTVVVIVVTIIYFIRKHKK